MTADDLSAVVRLHHASFGVRSTRRFLEKAYLPATLDRREEGLAWVAAAGGQPVAYLTGASDDARFQRRLLLRHPLESLLAATARAARGALHPSEVMRLGGALPRGHPARHLAWIHWEATDPAFRRQGHMSALVRRFLAETETHSISESWTRIETGNVASRRLHERLGFSLSGPDDPRGRVLFYRFVAAGRAGERADQDR